GGRAGGGVGWHGLSAPKFKARSRQQSLPAINPVFQHLKEHQMNRSKLQAPEFYAKPIRKHTESRRFITQPAWNDSVPATIGPEEEIDDALVSTNEMCFSG